MTKGKYIVVAGPTASGKSALALELAQRLQGEIVNCDSIQVYRQLDIGSAKPSPEEMSLVTHHLFDILSPDQEFDANMYASLAQKTIEEILSRGKVPIVVGGTGLYLRALWGQNFDRLPKSEPLREQLSTLSSDDLIKIIEEKAPHRKGKIHPNDRFRLQRAAELAILVGDKEVAIPESQDSSEDAFKIYCKVDRGFLHQRIALRTSQMLAQGLKEEVQKLLSEYSPQIKPLQSIGYKQVIDFILGKEDESNLEQAITIATRQYAKRQETWFRKVSFDYYYKNTSDIEGLMDQLKLRISIDF